jgi:hypothetical protein
VGTTPIRTGLLTFGFLGLLSANGKIIKYLNEEEDQKADFCPR